jgi:hypothetical protein
VAPNRSFAYRNNSVKNRYELDRTRNVKNLSTRNDLAYTTRNNNQKGQFRNTDRNTTRYSSNSIKTPSTRNATTIKNSDRSNSFAETRNPIRNEIPKRDKTNGREESLFASTNPIRNAMPSRANEGVRENASNGSRSSRSNIEYQTNRTPETRSGNSYQNSPSKNNSRIENTRSNATQSRNESNSRSVNTGRQNNASTSRRTL